MKHHGQRKATEDDADADADAAWGQLASRVPLLKGESNYYIWEPAMAGWLADMGCDDVVTGATTATTTTTATATATASTALPIHLRRQATATATARTTTVRNAEAWLAAITSRLTPWVIKRSGIRALPDAASVWAVLRRQYGYEAPAARSRLLRQLDEIHCEDFDSVRRFGKAFGAVVAKLRCGGEALPPHRVRRYFLGATQATYPEMREAVMGAAVGPAVAREDCLSLEEMMEELRFHDCLARAAAGQQGAEVGRRGKPVVECWDCGLRGRKRGHRGCTESAIYKSVSDCLKSLPSQGIQL